jgi:hypothetical protein
MLLDLDLRTFVVASDVRGNQGDPIVSGCVEARHFGCFDALSRISTDELI